MELGNFDQAMKGKINACKYYLKFGKLGFLGYFWGTSQVSSVEAYFIEWYLLDFNTCSVW